MWDLFEKWLPLDVAATKFGYTNKTSFYHRICQLRQQGLVADIGRPPAKYKSKVKPDLPVVIMWPNSRTALLRSDAPAKLFNSRRGKRASKKI